jgi:hypothetical protein
MSNPKHQGTMENCQIVQDVGSLKFRCICTNFEAAIFRTNLWYLFVYSKVWSWFYLNNALVSSNCTNIMSFCTVDNPRLITHADNLLLTIWGIHYRTIQNTYWYLVVSDPFIIVRVMVFNTTFNNISVLLVEETRVPRENHWVTESFINFPIAFIVNFVIWCWDDLTFQWTTI